MPYASTVATKNALQYLACRQPKAASANPEEFYDMSFLRRIDESSFVRQIKKSRKIGTEAGFGK